MAEPASNFSKSIKYLQSQYFNGVVTTKPPWFYEFMIVERYRIEGMADIFIFHNALVLFE